MRTLAWTLWLLLPACRPLHVPPCGPPEAHDCEPIHREEPPILVDADAPERPAGVWGAADLHAHPSNHLAYAGREDGTGGLFYGRPGTLRGRVHPLRELGDLRLADELHGLREPGRLWIGPEDSCDGETHIDGTSDSATRVTQSLVFAFLGADGHRPHVPMWSPSRGDVDCGAPPPSLVRYPHAQDLFHQQMDVESIRRAFEGGLRLMFASVADNQSIEQILRVTLAPGPIELDPNAEHVSVERQLRYLEHLVADNDDWMAIATTPQQARDIIRDDRLALILSLEMDWLPIDEVRRLHALGFRHIMPIHVADNPVGGAAAYNSVFNLHTALYSRALGDPEGDYFALETDTCVRDRVTAPLSATLMFGLLLFPGELDAGRYAALGYEGTDICGDDPVRSVNRLGHRNALGLRDVGYVRELMRMGMIVDVAHMSHRSAADTIAEGEGWDYPILDTHTGIARAGELIASDRELPLGLARRIYRNAHGVVGLGTGPQGRVLRTLVHAVGSPLVNLGPGEPPQEVRLRPRTTDDAMALGRLAEENSRLCLGGPAAAASGFLRIRFCDHGLASGEATDAIDVRLTPAEGQPGVGCTPPELGVRLVDRTIASIEYHGAYDATCVATRRDEPGAFPGVFNAAYVETPSGVLALGLPSNDSANTPFQPPGPIPIYAAECATAFACTDAHLSGAEVPATPTSIERPAVVPGRHVLRVRVTPAAGFNNRTRGDNAAYGGTDVRVHLGLGGLGERVISISAGGTVVDDGELHAYTIVDSPGDISVTSVRLSLASEDSRPERWRAAQVVVEEIEDPILAWVRSYAELRAEIAAERGMDERAIPLADVVFAIGTDLNGFAAQFPISALDANARHCGAFEVCDPTTGACAHLELGERGMANYAMLNDFFAAIAAADELLGTDVGDAFFSSAEATIRAWEYAELAAPRVRP